jgi:TolA-binding protein
MPDLMSQIQAANRELEVPVDLERLRAGVQRKRRTRSLVRKVAAGGLIAGLAASALVLLRPPRSDVRVVTNQSQSAAEPGVKTRSLTGDTQLETVLDEPSRAELSLTRGAARFEVDPKRRRTVTVRARFVSVEVVGTIFEVRHVTDGSVKVSVERGQVRVDWPEGSTELRAGQERTFEREKLAAPAPAPAPSVVTKDTPEPPTGWRQLAQQGDSQAAYVALKALGAAAVRDEPGDLFLAADVARRSGHAGEAVGPLRKLVTKYPGDGRAPSAAFTVGLLELAESPATAAESFATCRRLQPGGPLAHDALAREVEAQSRAGNGAAARTLAQQYLKGYPNGSRIKAVKHFGGLP